MTWTIVARDAATGNLGIATTTHAFGVGPVADWPRAGVGVVATQAFVEVAYGPRGLDLLDQGLTPQAVLDRLTAADADHEMRQAAVMDTAGRLAHFTGTRCVPSCGAVVGEQVVVLGNMLADDGVLTETLAAYERTDGPLAERLLAGLDAGQAAGGDARGTMSAALKVVSPDPPGERWQGSILDLRVDFGPDPLAEIRRAYQVQQAYLVFFNAVFAPGIISGELPLVGPELDSALAALDGAQVTLGDDREATLWQGVLLMRAGRTDDGAARIASALAARPEFARFVDGLNEVGILPLGSAEILRKAHALGSALKTW
jgi:uncharacterized Ntn-hydrolase superfamily protein